MGICAVMNYAQTIGLETVGQRLGIGNDLSLKKLVFRSLCQFERHGDAGDIVHVRAALLSGEHSSIDLVRDILISADDHRSARAHERFVRGERSHVRDAHRVWIYAANYQAY